MNETSTTYLEAIESLIAFYGESRKFKVRYTIMDAAQLRKVSKMLSSSQPTHIFRSGVIYDVQGGGEAAVSIKPV